MTPPAPCPLCGKLPRACGCGGEALAARSATGTRFPVSDNLTVCIEPRDAGASALAGQSTSAFRVIVDLGAGPTLGAVEWRAAGMWVRMHAEQAWRKRYPINADDGGVDELRQAILDLAGGPFRVGYGHVAQLMRAELWEALQDRHDPQRALVVLEACGIRRGKAQEIVVTASQRVSRGDVPFSEADGDLITDETIKQLCWNERRRKTLRS